MTTTGIASTIAEQIGHKAFVMFGASNLLADERSLQFKVGRNASKVTHVRVTLDWTDTYTVEFFRVGRAPRFEATTLDSLGMVYADQLRSLIGQKTGMDWTL